MAEPDTEVTEYSRGKHLFIHYHSTKGCCLLSRGQALISENTKKTNLFPALKELRVTACGKCWREGRAPPEASQLVCRVSDSRMHRDKVKQESVAKQWTKASQQRGRSSRTQPGYGALPGVHTHHGARLCEWLLSLGGTICKKEWVLRLTLCVWIYLLLLLSDGFWGICPSFWTKKLLSRLHCN